MYLLSFYDKQIPGETTILDKIVQYFMIILFFHVKQWNVSMAN